MAYDDGTDQGKPLGKISRIGGMPIVQAISRAITIFGGPASIATLAYLSIVTNSIQADVKGIHQDLTAITKRVDRLETNEEGNKDRYQQIKDMRDRQIGDIQQSLTSFDATIRALDRTMSSFDNRLKCMERNIKGGCP